MTWLHDAIVWLGGLLIALAAAIGLGGDRGPLHVQGYVEGEYVYVGAPVAGRLETLHVARGAQVAAGAPCSSSTAPASSRPGTRLPPDWRAPRPTSPTSGKASARRRSSRSRRSWPRRKAMLQWSEVALKRREQLVETRAGSREAVDEARAAYDRDKARVAELQAELKTAQLGARADEIQAAEAEVTAARAQLAQAEWRLDQLSQAAPQAGVVVDTLYRPGEWVSAGAPVGVAPAARERQGALLRARAAARRDRGRRRGARELRCLRRGT